MATKLKILVDSYFPYELASRDVEITSIKDYKSRKMLRLVPTFILLYYFGFRFDILMTARKDGKFLGLLYYVIKPANIKHVLYEFIYDFDKTNLRTYISRLIWIICIRKIDKIFVQSSAEISYYAKLFRVNKRKFIFIPVGIPFHNNFVGPSHKGYIFSGGKTNRDYSLFIKALSQTGITSVIVASSKDARLFQGVPTNFKIYFDIDQAMYQDLLAQSKVVVVPLRSGVSSRGQIVLLQAMALGKPVICTDVPSIRDYLKDGINGFFVPPGDFVALRNKILSVYEDTQLLNEIGLMAYNTAKNSFGTKNFQANFLSSLENVF